MKSILICWAVWREPGISHAPSTSRSYSKWLHPRYVSEYMLNICYLPCYTSRKGGKRTSLKVATQRTQKMNPRRKKHENLRCVILTHTLFVLGLHALIKPPKNSDIGTANIPHNDNIRSLHEQWGCNKKPGCSSEHCFINQVDSSHFPLGHKHFDTWGAATVCRICIGIKSNMHTYVQNI